MTRDVWLWAKLLTSLSLDLFICKMRRWRPQWIFRSVLCMKFQVLWLGPWNAWHKLSFIASFSFVFKHGIQKRHGVLLHSVVKKCLKCPMLNSLCSPQRAFFSGIPCCGQQHHIHPISQFGTLPIITTPPCRLLFLPPDLALCRNP